MKRPAGNSSLLNCHILTFYFIVMFLVAPQAYCSQISNHVRVAYLAMNDPGTPEKIHQLIKRNQKYYQNGSAGPDILNLVGQYSGLAVKAHYKNTGKLIKTMLQLAATESDPVKREQQLAYTLGWITHGYLDVFEHAVVNQYGGYFKTNEHRHKKLELFESTHVMAISQFPIESFVTDRLSLPAQFLQRTFLETYPLALDLGFEAADLWLAATVMEGFTANMVKEFSTQKRQNTVAASVYQEKPGLAPLCLEYSEILSPLFIGIDSSYVRLSEEPESSVIKAGFTFHVQDNSLMVSYISDWYESNRKAVKSIVARFIYLADFLSVQNGRIAIAPDIDPAVRDYDWDTGRLESTGDRYAIKVSENFKFIEELELLWEIYDENRRVTAGTESIFLLQPDLVGTFSFTIPMTERIYSEVSGRHLKMKAALRAKNNNTMRSMPGPYATAFEFLLDEDTCRIQLPVSNRAPIEATDEKAFWVPAPIEVKKGGLVQGKKKKS